MSYLYRGHNCLFQPRHLSHRASAHAAVSVAPTAPPPCPKAIQHLIELVASSSHVTVLTGAGVSTESGIPDYRSVNGAYTQGHKPMTHQEFISRHSNRQRYWARSFLGWEKFSRRLPNGAHLALSKLHENNWIQSIITQNVDRLHHKAAVNERKHSIIELHGTTHEVVCLSCGHIQCRNEVQKQLSDLNPHLALRAQVEEETRRDQSPQRPDGDVDHNKDSSDIMIPSCSSCGGILKPQVIFFGDNLPRNRAEESMAIARRSDLMMVVGTTLSTQSSFRLAEATKKNGGTLVAVNIGPLVKGPDLVDLKIDARASEVLTRLAFSPRLSLPKI